MITGTWSITSEITHKQTHKWTDKQILPNLLSPRYAVDKDLLNVCECVFFVCLFFNYLGNLISNGRVLNFTENGDRPGRQVLILSYSQYCRYKAVLKRLEGAPDKDHWLKVITHSFMFH